MLGGQLLVDGISSIVNNSAEEFGGGGYYTPPKYQEAEA